MKIKLVKIGRLALPVHPLIDLYSQRLKPFVKLELSYLKSNELLLRQLADTKTRGQTFLVLLDERGSQLSSPDLATLVQAKSDHSAVKTLLFAVGDPHGLGDALRLEADLLWSLSKSVFPADLAWLLLCEQVYRAFQIMHKTGYHHGD